MEYINIFKVLNTGLAFQYADIDYDADQQKKLIK